jgi:hypothetical protein
MLSESDGSFVITVTIQEHGSVRAAYNAGEEILSSQEDDPVQHARRHRRMGMLATTMTQPQSRYAYDNEPACG